MEYINEVQKTQVTRNEIIDFFNRMGDNPRNNGRFMTMLYVKPLVIYKKKNQWRKDDVEDALNKYNNYSDREWYQKLKDYNQDGVKGYNPITSVIIVRRYLICWYDDQAIARLQGEKLEKRRELNMRNGIAVVKAGVIKDNPNPTHKLDSGVQINSNTGNASRYFNLEGAKVKTFAYLVGDDGHIIEEIPYDLAGTMMTKKGSGTRRDDPEVKAALSGEALEAYRKAVAELDKNYLIYNFLYDGILGLAAGIDGEKYYYINDKISTKINKGSDVNVNQGELVKIAEEVLNQSFNEMPL